MIKDIIAAFPTKLFWTILIVLLPAILFGQYVIGPLLKWLLGV